MRKCAQMSLRWRKRVLSARALKVRSLPFYDACKCILNACIFSKTLTFHLREGELISKFQGYFKLKAVQFDFKISQTSLLILTHDQLINNKNTYLITMKN